MDASGSEPNEKRASFLKDVKKLHDCRRQIQQKWDEVSSGIVLEAVPNKNLIETSPGIFDAAQRQKDISGSVVQSMAALHEVATAAVPVFGSLLELMLVTLNLPPDSLFMTSLKKSDRAEERDLTAYGKRPFGPGVAWLFDVVRASVVLDTEADIVACVEYLMNAPAPASSVADSTFSVVSLENRFAKPNPSGYRDFNVNIQITFSHDSANTVSHICELQVHHRQLKDFSEELCSQEVYTIFRKYFDGGGAGSAEMRLRIMDRICGSLEADGEKVKAGGGSGELSLVNEATIEIEVERLCAEGDMDSMEAAAELLEAMCDYELAVQIKNAQIERIGPNHKDTLGITKKLASLLVEHGKYEEGKKRYECVLAEQMKVLGPGHPSANLAQETLGNVLSAACVDLRSSTDLQTPPVNYLSDSCSSSPSFFPSLTSTSSFPLLVLDCTYGWPSEKVPRRERINGVASQLFNHLSTFSSIRSSLLHVIGRESDLNPLKTRLHSLLQSSPSTSSESLSYHSFDSLASYLSNLRAATPAFADVPCHYMSPDAPLRLSSLQPPPLLMVVGGLIDRKTVKGRSLQQASSLAAEGVLPACLPLSDLSVAGLGDDEPLNVDAILDMLEGWHQEEPGGEGGGKEAFRRAASAAMERHRLRHPKRTLHNN